MNRETIIILIVILLIVVSVIGYSFWKTEKKYQACLMSCGKGYFSDYLNYENSEVSKCRSKCREKYGR